MGIKVQPKITDYLASFLEEAAHVLSTDIRGALEQLLLRIEILARNDKLDIGLEWTEVMKLVNSSGLGVQPIPEASLATEKMEEPADLTGFDVSLLETGGKARSGFVGVYSTTGGTYRALVESPTGNRYLPSRKTAVEAAIDRYRWFEEMGMPYGKLAVLVKAVRAREPLCTLEQALILVAQDYAYTPGYETFVGVTREQVEQTLRRHRKVLGVADTGVPDVEL